MRKVFASAVVGSLGRQLVVLGGRPMTTDTDVWAAQGRLEDAYLEAFRLSPAFAVAHVYSSALDQIEDLPMDEKIKCLDRATAILVDFARGKIGLVDLPPLYEPKA
jgi:hypothetical protein